jgi:hypothetical protein
VSEHVFEWVIDLLSSGVLVVRFVLLFCSYMISSVLFWFFCSPAVEFLLCYGLLLLFSLLCSSAVEVLM